MAGPATRPKTAITSMRFEVSVMRAAKRKADSLGISRRQYVEQLVRRDLGMGVMPEIVVTEGAGGGQPQSVFE